MKRTDLEQIKKAIIFIGTFKKNEKGEQRSVLTGTASLINVEGINYIITAKHVVCELDEKGKVIEEKKDLCFFAKGKNKNGKVVAGGLKKDKIPWFYHENENVDLVIIPFKFLPSALFDINSLPTDLFINREEVYETNDIFFISFQPDISKIEEDNDINPIVRRGMISRINNDGTYYIDGSAFPGNSGSPVYMLPSAFRFTESGISIGGDKLGGKLVGIIGAYLPYEDIAVSLQTKRARVIFEENTGLSLVWSTKHIMEIVESKKFQEALNLFKNDNS